MHLLDDMRLIESEILTPPTISTFEHSLPAYITLHGIMHMRAGPCPIPKRSGGIMGLGPIHLIYMLPIVLLHTRGVASKISLVRPRRITNTPLIM